ncbi:hypothetical protein AB0C47_11685 [Micromonospora taraxaci]|uniref:hypothetical protein n=1 Tax=Micromonospora taraxaci TaxID=1316803 RepID=UPI0033E62476
MRLTHSLPAVALGAAALGAALGADPAHAHQSTPLPSPTGLRPAQAPVSPNIVEALVPRVVESPLSIALPPPSPVPLPLPSGIPLPLPSAAPLPLPSSVPLPAAPLPSTSVKPPTAIPDLPRTPRTSPSPTARVASPATSPAARPAAPPQPSPSAATVTVTVSRGDVHGAAGGRTWSADQPPATVAAAAAPTPGPPVRPDSGPPAFVLALATAPSGFGASGVDAPTSAAERPPPISPLSRGLTVAAVDMRATSRPVERGPPPPQQLLITQPRPRR